MPGRTLLVLAVALLALPGCVTTLTYLRLERDDEVSPRGGDAVRTPDGVVHMRAHYEGTPSLGFVSRNGGWTAEAAGALPPVGDRLTVSRTWVADGVVLDDDGRCRVMAHGESVASGTLNAWRDPPEWRQALLWVLMPLTLGVDVATLPVQAGFLIVVMSSDRGLIGGLLP